MEEGGGKNGESLRGCEKRKEREGGGKGKELSIQIGGRGDRGESQTMKMKASSFSRTLLSLYSWLNGVI